MPLHTLPASTVARLLRAALTGPPLPLLRPVEWVALKDYGYPDPATMRGHLPYLDRMGRRRVGFTLPGKPRGRAAEARP